MKKILAATALLVVAGTATAYAGVNFNVNVDVPVPVAPAPPPVVVAYPPAQAYPPADVVTYPAPAPQVVVAQPPTFIYSPELGYYISVGTDLPIVYLNNGYYVYNGGYWWVGPTYGGPWNIVGWRSVPYGLRTYRYPQIVQFRDREYRAYLHDRGHYRGRFYRPEAVRRAEHRERWREERREWEHDRGEHRGWDR